MAQDEASSATPAHHVQGVAFIERRRGQTVVVVRGDHDMATAAALSETMSLAISSADADLVMDLSAVTFMDAATVDVIARAHELLVTRSDALVVQSPSRPARYILELCGLEHLLAPESAGLRAAESASALGTWVTVPKTAPTAPRSA